MTKYDVELTITGTVFVEVEAEDEDEAHDLARENWRDENSVGDLQVDLVNVERVREMTA